MSASGRTRGHKLTRPISKCNAAAQQRAAHSRCSHSAAGDWREHVEVGQLTTMRTPCVGMEWIVGSSRSLARSMYLTIADPRSSQSRMNNHGRRRRVKGHERPRGCDREPQLFFTVQPLALGNNAGVCRRTQTKLQAKQPHEPIQIFFRGQARALSKYCASSRY